MVIACMFHLNMIHAETGSSKIEGLTGWNFPAVESEQWFYDVFEVMTCHLFNLQYSWYTPQEWRFTGERFRVIDFSPYSTEESKSLKANLYFQTDFYGEEYVRKDLMKGNIPLALLATPLSEEEMKAANDSGISVACKPIGLDATIFLNHQKNPVDDLTRLQIQKIFTGEYTQWSCVNGSDTFISSSVDGDKDNTAYFKQQFLDGKELKNKYIWWYEDDPDRETKRILFRRLYEKNDKGYVYCARYLFRALHFDNEWARIMKVDGVLPTQESILDGSYPYSMNIYVAVNTDTVAHPMANKIYDYLTTAEGQQMLYDYGYIPLKKRTDGIMDQPLPEVAPEIKYADGYLVARPMAVPQRIAVMDLNGKRIADVVVPAGVDRVAVTLQPGIYLVKVVPEKGRPAVIKIAVTQ